MSDDPAPEQASTGLHGGDVVSFAAGTPYLVHAVTDVDAACLCATSGE